MRVDEIDPGSGIVDQNFMELPHDLFYFKRYLGGFVMSGNEFDTFVDKLQNEVFTDAKNALGEKGFERWKNPKFCGKIKDADSFARLTGGCGDTMEMYIKIQNGRVKKVRYMTDGCSSSSIAGSFTAELAMGKTFEEVLDLRGTDVLQVIGQFPKNEEHCAHLAVRTLQEALNTFLIKMMKKSINSEKINCWR